MLDQEISWCLGYTCILLEARLLRVYAIPSNQLFISVGDRLVLTIFSYPFMILFTLVIHWILSFSRLYFWNSFFLQKNEYHCVACNSYLFSNSSAVCNIKYQFLHWSFHCFPADIFNGKLVWPCLRLTVAMVLCASLRDWIVTRTDRKIGKTLILPNSKEIFSL